MPGDDPADIKVRRAEPARHPGRRSAAAAGLDRPRLTVEPGRAIAGPGTVTLYEVGTVKDVDGLRTYVSVDGGMSDNIRTALYDAEYTCVLASRESGAPPVLCRLVGRHCESGDIVVRDAYLPGRRGRGRPDRGGRHRRLLPVDGEQLQPRAAARRWSPSATARRGSCCAGRPPTTCCASTPDDGSMTAEDAAPRPDGGAAAAPKKASTTLADGRELIYFGDSADWAAGLPRSPGPRRHPRLVAGALRPAARRVGDHRQPPAGPHLPAAGRPLPAVPVDARPPHRDPRAQTTRWWCSRTGSPRWSPGPAATAARPGGLLADRARATAGARWSASARTTTASFADLTHDQARAGAGRLDRPHRGAGRAARRRAGVLLREPGPGDRRDAEPPARPDLRLPVRHPAHRAHARDRRARTSATPAATCSTTCSRPSWPTGRGS